jgi:hypothetical protein
VTTVTTMASMSSRSVPRRNGHLMSILIFGASTCTCAPRATHNHPGTIAAHVNLVQHTLGTHVTGQMRPSQSRIWRFETVDVAQTNDRFKAPNLDWVGSHPPSRTSTTVYTTSTPELSVRTQAQHAV